jgi:hypothetical protein
MLFSLSYLNYGKFSCAWKHLYPSITTWSNGPWLKVPHGRSHYVEERYQAPRPTEPSDGSWWTTPLFLLPLPCPVHFVSPDSLPSPTCRRSPTQIRPAACMCRPRLSAKVRSISPSMQGAVCARSIRVTDVLSEWFPWYVDTAYRRHLT